AGIEQLGLLRDLDMGMIAAGNLRCDHRPLVMDVDDDVLDAGQRQPVDRVVEQATPIYLDERLWHGVGDRAQSAAETGSQHHSRARRRHTVSREPGIRRAACGKWRSSHFAIFSREGWPSSSSSW